MYQVWTKAEYDQGWQRKDCPDIPTALVEVLVSIKAGKEPLLTAEVIFDVSINIKEDKKVETAQSEAKPDKVAGGESHKRIRRGDPKPANSPDKGNGSDSTDNRAGD